MDDLNEARWRAVEARDEDTVGCFVYAVSTTGVYCRPGCGSRRPLRRNVTFYSTASEAQESGFRACRRCSPDAPHVTDPSVSAVIALCRELERDTEADVTSLASNLGYSERHLRRRFVDTIGVSVSKYVRAQRAERLRASLRDGVGVTDAVFDAGYGSMSAFYEEAPARLGMTPGRYRDGGRGELIRFTTLETPIGVVLAACTARGLCAVQVGSDDGALTLSLKEEFPHAMIERDDEGLRDVAVVLALAVRGDAPTPQLPLDLVGTAFQLRVWEALRTIPAGETRTYSQLASQIGAPKAVRAVGSACGANAVAIVIPCHRVVRTDGSLGGYRWGLSVKEALLANERSASDALSRLA